MVQLYHKDSPGFSLLNEKIASAILQLTLTLRLSFWQYNDREQNTQLMELLDLIRSAGVTIINGTELPYYKDIVNPQWWNWDYGAQRGYLNESEYTCVKVDFLNNIKTYLSELENTNIWSLEDIVTYNNDNAGSEGGIPGVNPAFASGQDGFLASLATEGVMNETYWQALTYHQRTSREDGIDAAVLQRPQSKCSSGPS